MLKKNEDHHPKDPVKPKIGKEYKVAATAILDCTLASYYNWAKESRPVISLLEKYYTKADLDEFLTTGAVSKYEATYITTNDRAFLNDIKTDLQEIKTFLIGDKEEGKITTEKETKKTKIMQSVIKILDISKPSYYVWKREGRPIFELLENYFTKEELEEFLTSQKMAKLEAIKGIDVEDINFILENKDMIRKLKEIKEILK